MLPEARDPLLKRFEAETVRINLPPLNEAINNGWYHLLVPEYYPDLEILRPIDIQIMVGTSQQISIDKARGVIEGIKRTRGFGDTSDPAKQTDINRYEAIVAQVVQDRHALVSDENPPCAIIWQSK